MASEYLKWKFRDVQPDPPPRELSKKEKILNFLDYYKWWLVAGAVGLVLLVNLIWTMLGIGKVRPDYIFAYVTDNKFSEEQEAALSAYLFSLDTSVTFYSIERMQDPKAQLDLQDGITTAAE